MLRGARALQSAASRYSLFASLESHTLRSSRHRMSAHTSTVSRAYPTEPRVGVGVVVLRELVVGKPETLLIRRAKAPNKGTSGVVFLVAYYIDYVIYMLLPLVAGAWCFPGGSLELGETLVDCAVRETLEETGIELRCNLPESSSTNRQDRHRKIPLSHTLEFPSSFIAGDAITYDDDGKLAFHYAIINIAGIPKDPCQPIAPGDDASEAQWFPVGTLRDLQGKTSNSKSLLGAEI